MVFWKSSDYSPWLFASFFGIAVLIFLATADIKQPQMLALKNARVLAEPITEIYKIDIGDAIAPTELAQQASTSPRNLSVPFLENGPQGQRLATIAYSFDLTNAIPQKPKPGEKGVLREAGNMYGVLFAQVLNGGDFYFNGNWVAGLTASSKNERWAWHTPFVVPLPPQLIKNNGQPNILTVVQKTHEPHSPIPRPYFGTLAESHRVADRIAFFGDSLSTASNLLCLVVGIFLLGVWTISPKERMYAVAGAASVLWAILLTLARWRQLDIALYGVWWWTIYALAHLLTYLMSMLVLSFVGQPLGKRGLAFIFSTACLGPILISIFGDSMEPFIKILLLLILLIFLYATSRLIEFCIRTRNFSACILLLQSVLCLTLAFHDYMIATGWIIFFDRQNPELTWSRLLFDNIYLSHLGAPLHLGVMAHILLRQHENNIAAVENRDAFIESSIREYESNFEEIHQQMTFLARSEGAAIERERIYQDLHDGIGSQLVKAIFTLDNLAPGLAGVKHNLQACLRDLRLVINASYEPVMDIQSAVFAFCQAQEDHLRGSGLTISYNVGVESTIYSDPKVNLNILRILQEVLCNTIKHSDASDVFVEVKTDNSDLLLIITDHGHNPSTNRSEKRNFLYGESSQKGTSNLASRAATLGGTYSFNITRSGTQVRLAIPLPKTSDDLTRDA